MIDPATPATASDYLGDDIMDLFIEYYNYRNIDPNELISNIFSPKSTTNELIEHKNSITINIVLKDENIKYNFIIMNREESLRTGEIANRQFFSIFPRRLGILETHIPKLYDLGRTLELTEICLLDDRNRFSIILFRDDNKEFHIRVNFIWSWFNIPYLMNLKKKGFIDRKLQLILYNKLKTSNLRLESLWEGS